MKLNCGPTPQERYKAKQEWHRFFALWPRRVGPGDCRWLEIIERKGTYNYIPVPGCGGWWEWEYRSLA